MKKFARWALALGLCLVLGVCGALADEAPGIRVQLDGQELTFTDAAPQVRDQRTFLPFRAVFEALDAEVDYEDDVVTAVRGGRTVTMTLGQSEATVTENGQVTTITMDVAPYVDDTTWRTYVPVRFAAQALDCAVGWDQNAYTAIIMDVDKLVDALTEGKRFTYLEKLGALDGKYDQGIWDVTAAFDAAMNMLGAPAMTISGDMTGAVQDGSQMEADMNMKMDMSGLMEMASSVGGEALEGEDLTALNALAQDGVDLALRGDVAAGKLYVNMDFSALAALSEGEKLPDANTWYEMDLAAILEELDLDWAELMAQSGGADLKGMAKLLIGLAEPDDVGDYLELKAALEELFTALSDEGFTLSDTMAVTLCPLPLEMDVGSAVLTLALDLDGEAVTGYTIGLQMSGQDEEQAMGMSMIVSVDAQNAMTAELTMNASEFVTLTMTMEGQYAPGSTAPGSTAPGSTAPVTAPPEGAAIVPWSELMGEDDADLGIIGGEDGPTAIFVD